jgi:histidine ammonia-lyase
VVGIELLAAAQGIDFHRPARSSPPLEAAHAAMRRDVAGYHADRYFAPDIQRARHWVQSGSLATEVAQILPSRAMA